MFDWKVKIRGDLNVTEQLFVLVTCQDVKHFLTGKIYIFKSQILMRLPRYLTIITWKKTAWEPNIIFR